MIQGLNESNWYSYSTEYFMHVTANEKVMETKIYKGDFTRMKKCMWSNINSYVGSPSSWERTKVNITTFIYEKVIDGLSYKIEFKPVHPYL